MVRRLATSWLTRAMRERKLRFYKYSPETDRLIPHDRIPEAGLDALDWILASSDRWYGALKQRAIRADVILDVGVSSGYTSVWFSRWARQVYAFEPNPANQASVREQLTIRGVRNVELIETAVSDHRGETDLFVKPQEGHHSLGDVGASETVDRIRVPVTTLDRFAAERGIERVGLLKIDVEGFEPEVLRGARDLLESRRIDLILFEHSPGFYRQRGIDPLAPVALLEEVGYRVTDIDGNAIDHAAIAELWQTDLLAAPG